CFGDFAEPLGRVRLAVEVGMESPREPAIGASDLAGGRVVGNTENIAGMAHLANIAAAHKRGLPAPLAVVTQLVPGRDAPRHKIRFPARRHHALRSATIGSTSVA